MIDSLPYFLNLIKSNILLQTIITSGGFSNADLKNIEHEVISDSSIEFFNFSLSPEDLFTTVNFFVTKDDSAPGHTIMTLMFSTTDSKYFENTKYYFGENEQEPIKNHPIIARQRLKRKDIGLIKMFDLPIPPARISIHKNPSYGYIVNLRFYSNYLELEREYDIRQKAFSQADSNRLE